MDEIECNRCRASIPADLPVCCNCGSIAPKPYRPLFNRTVTTVVVVMLVVIGGGWTRFAPLARISGSTSLEASTVEAPVQTAPQTAPVPIKFSAEKRWTRTWVNVREDPTVTSPVVLVLDPGIEIEVGNKEGAWWEARMDGRVVGYLSNTVLSTEPPVLE